MMPDPADNPGSDGPARQPALRPDASPWPARCEGAAAREGPLTRAVLYPGVYTWFVFLAALDLMCTWIVLHAGGGEVNALADWIINHGGLPAVIAYKFGLVVLVVLICETVGMQRRRLGRWLAQWAVLATAVPVVVSLAQLLVVVVVDSTL